MLRLTRSLTPLAIALALLPARATAEDKVTLPLQTWEEIQRTLDEANRAAEAPLEVVPIDRSISGALRKGLFSGKLVSRFEVLDARNHVRVPVFDAEASLGEVRLNGQRTSVRRDGDLYTVGVDKPGVYRLEAEITWGQEQDRFARRLRFRLPEGGATHFSIRIPERDIEPRLEKGAIVAQDRREDGTQIEGRLEPTGSLDLSWNRKLTHSQRSAARWESRLFTVFTVQEALVRGVSTFDLELRSGEADRLDLRLPKGLEVLRVEGDAVLQWQTDSRTDGLLTVLFRYLVEKKTRVTVHFQVPIDTSAQVELRMPMPPVGLPVVGAFGVQGPAGLNVQPVDASPGGDELPRDLPSELTELASSPLLLGRRFDAEPKIDLRISRHQEVNLTSTIIDDIQASTVVNEDGVEISKVKLRMRNNTRQYLRLRLPEGSVLTHSLIDGEPVRPAFSREQSGADSLLFPLRQSERISQGKERIHEVAMGDTLSDIANFYFSDPAQWRAIIRANPDLKGETELVPGRRLRIPPRGNAAMQESTFVIELAFKRNQRPLGWIGRTEIDLPEVDVDTVEVTWHLYLPQSLSPLRFDANLTQYSSIRYDPFRRVRDFLHGVLRIHDAWAGGGGYENILSKRQIIYKSEASGDETSKMILSEFPLVGERYQFRSILIGQQRPHIAVSYLDSALVVPVRVLTLLCALLLGLLLLRRGEPKARLAAALGFAALLVASYFVMGMHRRILWGLDLALLVTIVRLRSHSLWQRLVALSREPWRLFEALTVGNLLRWLIALIVMSIMTLFPLLLSTLAGGVLWLVWYRISRSESTSSTSGASHA